MPDLRQKPPPAEKKKRLYLTIPITNAMQNAVIRASRRALLKKAPWARQFVLAQTDYDPETDPELPLLMAREKKVP